MTHYSLNSTPIRQNVVKPAMKANLQNLDADLSRIFGYLFFKPPFYAQTGSERSHLRFYRHELVFHAILPTAK
jgi:hypothetical protein